MKAEFLFEVSSSTLFTNSIVEKLPWLPQLFFKKPIKAVISAKLTLLIPFSPGISMPGLYSVPATLTGPVNPCSSRAVKRSELPVTHSLFASDGLAKSNP